VDSANVELIFDCAVSSFDIAPFVFFTPFGDALAERETGARGLRSILERSGQAVRAALASRRAQVRRHEETISKGLKPTLVAEAARDEDELTAAAGTA
jgi:hypothetical protein